MEGPSSYEEWFCPSFSSYSASDNHQIADIATRVISQEIQQQQLHDSADSAINTDSHLRREISSIYDDFQFVLLPPKGEDEFTIGGDYRVGYLYPVFNRDLLLSDGFGIEEDDTINSIRLTLKKFLTDQNHQDLSSSSSSSEADDLEEIPHETYCVWTPKSPSPSITDSISPGRWKKSSSTGSSSSSSKQKLWRLRDLLRRSRSDGKESPVSLQNSNNNHEDLEKKKAKNEVKSKERLISAHEAFYVRNKASKEKEKKKTFLPYRQDIFVGVSVFAK